MPRRRFTKEQRERISIARAKQQRACARGNHWWYPDFRFKTEERRRVEPRFWTTNERYPMPIWDGETVVCSARKCGTHSEMSNLTLKKQKQMRDIFDGFVENTISMRKDREQSQEASDGRS